MPGAQPGEAPSPALQRRLDAGNSFEAEVFAELVALHPGEAVVVAGVDETLAAMRAGKLLVLGGQLPHDEAGGRVGKPDILLRVEDAGYVPVDVKHYRQLGAENKRMNRTMSRYSTLAEPANVRELPQVSNYTEHRFNACLQLAHYTRMLQACGFHPGPRWLRGAVIGTSRVGGELVLGWFDLTAPLFESYSRSRAGTVKRSALERYDHEFGFRRLVAQLAGQGRERPVEPIWQRECLECPYRSRCWAEIEGLAHRDVTFETLSVREWKTLARLGVGTTADLAAVDLDQSDLLARLVPEVGHSEARVRRRMERAVRRARLVVAGLPWECTADEVVVPSADVEIDVDMENQQRGGLVYMWGVRVAGAGHVDDFHTWEPLTPELATALALRYFRWLQRQISDAGTAGRSIKIFHWSHPEVTKLRGHLAGTEVTPAEFEAVAACHVDLEKFFREHFFALHGTGLKAVAPALGFRWPDGDAGGEHSLAMVEKAQAGDVRAREWLVGYNHADTAATAHIREALRTLDLRPFR